MASFTRSPNSNETIRVAVVKEGSLKKRQANDGSFRDVKWREHWVVLHRTEALVGNMWMWRKSELILFNSERDCQISAEPADLLSLPESFPAIAYGSERSNTFHLSTTNGRTLVLMAADEADRTEWVDAIQRLAFEQKKPWEQPKGVLPQDLFLERVGQARSKHYDGQRSPGSSGRNETLNRIRSSTSSSDGNRSPSPGSSGMTSPSSRALDDTVFDSRAASPVEDEPRKRRGLGRLLRFGTGGPSSSFDDGHAISGRTRAASDATVRSASATELPQPSGPHRGSAGSIPASSTSSRTIASRSNDQLTTSPSPVSPVSSGSSSSSSAASTIRSSSLRTRKPFGPQLDVEPRPISLAQRHSADDEIPQTRTNLTRVNSATRSSVPNSATSIGSSRGSMPGYQPSPGYHQSPLHPGMSGQYHGGPAGLHPAAVRAAAAGSHHGRSSSSPVHTLSRLPPPELQLGGATIGIPAGAGHHRSSGASHRQASPHVPPSPTAWGPTGIALDKPGTGYDGTARSHTGYEGPSRTPSPGPQDRTTLQRGPSLQHAPRSAVAGPAGSHQKSSSSGAVPAASAGASATSPPETSPARNITTPTPPASRQSTSPSPPTGDRLNIGLLGQASGDDRRMFDLLERVQGNQLDSQRASLPTERRSRSADLDATKRAREEEAAAAGSTVSTITASSSSRSSSLLRSGGRRQPTGDPDVERAKRPPLSDGLAGYLYKKTPGSFGRTAWARRWFCIREGLLMYTRREGDTTLAFAANLLHTIAVPVEVPDRAFCFEVRGTYKTFVLQAPSEANMRLWISGIEKAAISKYQPDAKIHFKCSHNNDLKRFCVSQNITLSALLEFLSSEFECHDGHNLCYEDHDGDLIFIRAQNDLDEAFFSDTNLRFFLIEKANSRRSSAAAPVSNPTSFGGTPTPSIPSMPSGTLSPVGRRGSFTRSERINWVMGEMIGSGAVGEVFLGLNIDTGELMAVKQVEHGEKNANMKGRVQQLIKEMEVLRTLDHPNIVRYLGVEYEGSCTTVFLEYVPGGSIHSLLTRFGFFDEKLIRIYTRQVLHGLQYLHDHGLVHRDIKGANLLVDAMGTVKLADFGMATKILAGANGRSVALMEMAGTPYWMAPEVVRRHAYGRPADVWSIGATVVEMATARPPWYHFSQEVAAIFHIATCKEPPKLPSWVSSDAVDFVAVCCTRRPEDRPDVATLLKHPFVAESPDSRRVPLSARDSTGHTPPMPRFQPTATSPPSDVRKPPLLAQSVPAPPPQQPSSIILTAASPDGTVMEEEGELAVVDGSRPISQLLARRISRDDLADAAEALSPQDRRRNVSLLISLPQDVNDTAVASSSATAGAAPASAPPRKSSTESDEVRMRTSSSSSSVASSTSTGRQQHQHMPVPTVLVSSASDDNVQFVGNSVTTARLSPVAEEGVIVLSKPSSTTDLSSLATTDRRGLRAASATSVPASPLSQQSTRLTVASASPAVPSTPQAASTVNSSSGTLSAAPPSAAPPAIAEDEEDDKREKDNEKEAVSSSPTRPAALSLTHVNHTATQGPPSPVAAVDTPKRQRKKPLSTRIAEFFSRSPSPNPSAAATTSPSSAIQGEASSTSLTGSPSGSRRWGIRRGSRPPSVIVTSVSADLAVRSSSGSNNAIAAAPASPSTRTHAIPQSLPMLSRLSPPQSPLSPSSPAAASTSVLDVAQKPYKTSSYRASAPAVGMSSSSPPPIDRSDIATAATSPVSANTLLRRSSTVRSKSSLMVASAAGLELTFRGNVQTGPEPSEYDSTLHLFTPAESKPITVWTDEAKGGTLRRDDPAALVRRRSSKRLVAQRAWAQSPSEAESPVSPSRRDTNRVMMLERLTETVVVLDRKQRVQVRSIETQTDE